MKMKTLVYSFFIGLSLLSGLTTGAQTIERNKSVTKSFLVSKDAEIEITNKYGNISIIPWSKDSVRFEVDITVKGTKQSRVDKSFDFIEVDFNNSKYYVIAQTLFAGKSSFWSDVSDLTGAIFNSNSKTRIDYTVHVPHSAKLKVNNKFGNVYTTDLDGIVEIDLSNGDLKAHHLSGYAKIKTEFGKADIKRMNEGEVTVNYGELILEESKKIQLESKSSEITIGDAGSLKIDSKRDKLKIESVNELTGLTYFTGVQVELLDGQVNLSAKYGDVEIRKFSDRSEKVVLSSSNSDVTLHFTDNKYYKMNITVDKETEVLYSAEISKISSSESNEDKNVLNVSCEVGSKSATKVPLKIDARGGSLALKRK